jgi:hypothetical protein
MDYLDRDAESGLRAADLYLRGQWIYIFSTERQNDRGWIHTPPGIALDEGVSGREIGAAVLTAVRKATPILGNRDLSGRWRQLLVPIDRDPDRIAGYEDPLLQLANVASHEEFRRGYRAAIHVWERDGNFTVTWLGSSPIVSPVFRVEVCHPTEEELGAAVHEGFSKVERDRQRWEERAEQALRVGAQTRWTVATVIVLALVVALVLLSLLR